MSDGSVESTTSHTTPEYENVKHFLRFGLAAVVAMTLGACAQVQQFEQNLSNVVSTVTTASIDYRQALAAVQTFETLQRAGQVYLSLPTCSKAQGAPCHNRQATKTINALLHAGRVARKQIIDFMDANPCSSTSCPLLPSGLFGSIQSVVADLNQVFNTYKVAKGS